MIIHNMLLVVTIKLLIKQKNRLCFGNHKILLYLPTENQL